MTSPASETPSDPRGLRRLFYGPSELRAGWRLLIFLALLFALYPAKAAVLRTLLRTSDEDARYLANKLLQFLVFVLATWLMGRLEGRRLADYGLPLRQAIGARFWQGLAIGFAAITILLVVLRAAFVFRFGTVALHGAAAWKYAGLYAVVFGLIALEEEFRYRGYALRTLASGIGFWPAAILLAAAFGYDHIGNRAETWMGALNAGAAGLFFSLLLRRTGALWMAIGFHAAWDWGESYFYGVPDSGVAVPGHLFNASFSGPAWLTGGSVGPEGSWLCLLLFVVLSVVIATRFRDAVFRPGVPNARD